MLALVTTFIMYDTIAIEIIIETGRGRHYRGISLGTLKTQDRRNL